MWKTQDYVRRRWPILRAPVLGLAIGAMLFLGVRAVSPHPGQSCSRLGQITEEWELGMAVPVVDCVVFDAATIKFSDPDSGAAGVDNAVVPNCGGCQSTLEISWPGTS